MSERISAILSEFGLTSLEARVYVMLYRLGECRAGQIAAALQLARPDVYRVLRGLSEFGLVQRVPGRPAIFAATPPRQGLKLLLARHKQKLISIERESTALVKSIESYSRLNIERSETFLLITGGANLIERSKQMIMDAKYDYAGILSKDALQRIRDDGVASALLSAKHRKVNVRLISEIDELSLLCAKFLSRHLELRRSQDVLFGMGIVDKNEMIFGPAITQSESTDRSAREMDLWTNNSRFIRGMYALFEKIWKTSPRFVAHSP
jgi:sugar-specific transcriptional regulator TrmB